MRKKVFIIRYDWPPFMGIVIPAYYRANTDWAYDNSADDDIRLFRTKEDAEDFIEKIKNHFLDEIRRNVDRDFDPNRLSVEEVERDVNDFLLISF